MMYSLYTLFYYSIPVSLSLAVLWAAWRLSGLRNLTHFGLNRSLLVSILLLSVTIGAIPFLPHPSAQQTTMADITYSIELPGSDREILPPTHDGTEAAASSSPGIYWLDIIVIIYGTGVAANLLMLLCSIGRIIRFMTSGRTMSYHGMRIVVHDLNRIVPFTWGNRIVMSQTDFAADAPMLTAHEGAHLRGRHWLDLLLSRIVESLTWYSPCARLLRHDLIECHEYEADRSVMTAGFNPADYQMLLINKASSRRFANSVADSFNCCSIKKRITMMQKTKSSRFSRIRAIGVLPALLLLALAVSSITIAACKTGNADGYIRVTGIRPGETVYIAALPVDLHALSVYPHPNQAPVQEATADESGTVTFHTEKEPYMYWYLNLNGGEGIYFIEPGDQVEITEGHPTMVKGGKIAETVNNDVYNPIHHAQQTLWSKERREGATAAEKADAQAEFNATVRKLALANLNNPGGVVALYYCDTRDAAEIYSKLSPAAYNNMLRPIYEKVGQHIKQAEDGARQAAAIESGPRFIGGEEGLYGYIARNIRYPEEAAQNNIQGRVELRLHISAHGLVDDVQVAKSSDSEDLDAEAVRVARTLPRFEPATDNTGLAVAAWYNLPISFKLE